MTEKKRMANLELLRILAMLMIIVMHFLRESGVLLGKEAALASQQLQAVNVLAFFLEAFCIVAVNVYVLISGYFATQSSFKAAKVIRFLGQIYFYALFIPLILKLAGVPIYADTTGIYGWVQYLLPISSEHYWFATSYFYLLLMMPVLNYGIKSMSSKQLSVVTGLLLAVFCGVKSICPIRLTMDRYGYDVLWFICVYLLGAWIYACGECTMQWMKKKAGLLYVGSALLIGTMVLALYGAAGKWEGAAYYFSVPFHYNFVFCLTAAVGLFFVFGNLSVKEGIWAEFIRKISKYCFGVYLLHEHLDVRHEWYRILGTVWAGGSKSGAAGFLLELVMCTAILFAAGIGIDFVRSCLFDRIEKWCRAAFGKKGR